MRTTSTHTAWAANGLLMRFLATVFVALLIITIGSTAAVAVTPQIAVTVDSIDRDADGNLEWEVTATTGDVQGGGQVCPNSWGGCWFYLYAQLEDGGTIQLQSSAITWGETFPYTKEFSGGPLDITKVIAVEAVVQGPGGFVYSGWKSVIDPLDSPEIMLDIDSVGRDAASDFTWDVTATAGDVQGAGQLCPTSSGGCWYYLYAQFEDGSTYQLESAAVTWGASFPFEHRFTGTFDSKRVIALAAYIQGPSGLLSSGWVPVSDTAVTPDIDVAVTSIGRNGSGDLTWDVTATTGDVQGTGQVCPNSSGCWFYLYGQTDSGSTPLLQSSSISWGETFPYAYEFTGSMNVGKIIAVEAVIQGSAGVLESGWNPVSDPQTVPSGSGSVTATINSTGRDASTGDLTFDVTATVSGADASDGPCGGVSYGCAVSIQARTSSGDLTTLKSTSLSAVSSSSTTLSGSTSTREIVAIRAFTTGTYAPRAFYSAWESVTDSYPSSSVAVTSAAVDRDESTGNLEFDVDAAVTGAIMPDGPCGGSSYHCYVYVQARNAAGDISTIKTADLSAVASYTGTLSGTLAHDEIVAVRIYTNAQYAPHPFYSAWTSVTDPYPSRSVEVTDVALGRDVATGQLAYAVAVSMDGASLSDGPCGGSSYHCYLYIQTRTESGDIHTIATADAPADATFQAVYSGLTETDKVVAVRAYTTGYYAPHRFFSHWVTVHDLDESEGIGGGNAAEKGCTCTNADPVNSETGEFYETVTDLAIPGTGPTVGTSRTYSAFHSTVNGPYGFGWAGDFGSRLVVDAGGDALSPHPRQVHIVQENGATVPFVRDDNGDYPADSWVLATLRYDDGNDTWIFTRSKTEVLVFDADGQLLSQSDLHGNTIDYDYASGHVVSVSGAGGREINLTWSSGRITSATDSAGREVTYAYDSAGNLEQVTDAAGGTWTYTYDSTHRLLTQTDPEGGTTTNVYNTASQVTSQTDPVGRITRFAYSALASTVTLPDGSVTTYAFDEGRPRSITSATGTAAESAVSYDYDEDGNLVSVTDPLGNITTSTFDSSGNELTTTDALDRTTTRTFDEDDNLTTIEDPLGRITEIEYNATRDITSLTGPGGHEQNWVLNPDGTTASYTDARNKTTSITYDDAGRPLCTTDPDARESCVEYDDRGYIVTSIDPAEAETTYSFDDLGRILTVMDPTDAETTTTYDGNGRPLTVEDPEGNVTAFTYDGAGQRLSTERPTGGVTNYTYAPRGGMATVTDPNGDVVTTTYDLMNRVSTVTDGEARTTSYSYDAAGRLLTTTRPSTATTTNTYDYAGQLLSTTDALGKTTTYEYDDAGQLVSVTDPLNRSTSISYTDDGLLDTVTRPDSSTEIHGYDANGQETSFTNADGVESTYAYTDGGLVASKTEPGGLDTAYSYDATGRLDEVTTPDSHTSERTYDDAGRLISINYQGSADDVALTYDDAGHRLTMTDATGTTTYVYTDDGQVESVENGDGALIGYEYDDAGRLATVTYPGNHDVDYGYDDAGQMTSVTGWQSGTSIFGYSADGHLESRTDPNGVTESRGHDAVGRLTGIVDATSATGFAAYGYTYDDAGQLVTSTLTDGLHTASTLTWGYDELGQLGSTGGSSYDATSAGLLTATSSGDELNYNTAGQLTTMTNPGSGVESTFDYDDNGARTSTIVDPPVGSTTTTGYGYTEPGALESVTSGLNNLSYATDGDGLRQSRTLNSSTRELLWDTNAAIPLLLDDDEHTYIYGPGATPIAQIDGTGEVEYLYGDNVGSIRTIADDSGSVVSTTDYDPFGVVTAHSGTSGSEIGYTGAWTDPLTDLVYLRARDYDPATGQFMSVDPLLTSTRQAYAYTGNNPLNSTDPLGLCDGSWCGYQDDPTPSTGPSQTCLASGTCFTSRGAASSYDFGDLSNPGANLANISFGIGDTFTMSPIAWAFGYGSITEWLRAATGTDCVIPKNSFRDFGAVWAGFAGGGLASAPGELAAMASRWSKVFSSKAGSTVARPPIKPGASGGDTAGMPFSTAVRNEALADNPSTCVYCHMETRTPQVDHAQPRSGGGNATLENAQTTCPWCNNSKNSSAYPKNPPPGYAGDWPPEWW